MLCYITRVILCYITYIMLCYVMASNCILFQYNCENKYKAALIY